VKGEVCTMLTSGGTTVVQHSALNPKIKCSNLAPKLEGTVVSVDNIYMKGVEFMIKCQIYVDDRLVLFRIPKVREVSRLIDRSASCQSD